MKGKKGTAKTRVGLASPLTKRNSGKSRLPVYETRETLKHLRDMEVEAIMAGKPSLILGLRREARERAKMLKSKKTKA